MAKISDRNTKAEILAAYHELQKEQESLKAEISKSPAAAPPPPPTPPATTPVKTVTPPAQPPKSNKSKLQSTLDNLTILQSTFGGVISELSDQLTSEATRLQELRNGVAEAEQHLLELHNIESISDDTLDVLIEQYHQSFKEFEEELSDRRETLEQEWQGQQATWKKEKEEHQQLVKERNQTETKNRERDQESYQYNLQLERDLDEEQYQQNQAELYQQLEELQQQKQQEWLERETAIAQREQEHLEVKTKVAEFEKNLEDAIKKGKEMGRNIGNYQAKIKADLWGKEVEGQKQFYELRVKSLSETISNQENRIQSISKQLDSALKQVQDLAVKAIEGSSNSNSFQAMKEIALEQAKNQQKGK
ncbi:hypothetical protein B9S53_08845 [Arthrospira sp. O9.13F]|nr:hypothetical protein B9S53_08845 [Arthrospira sp. O9.13F]